MQIPGYHDFLRAPPRGRISRRLSGLAQAGINPYPNGLTVAGTGPNGSSTIWKTGFHTALGVWVADTGFGIAPIYHDADWPQITATYNAALILKGFNNHVFMDVTGAGMWPEDNTSPYTITTAGFGAASYDPGSNLVVQTPDGGSQTIAYDKDNSTGLWISTSARGAAAHGIGIFDRLIEAGAIIGASIAVAGAAGFLGPTTAGPGAEAVGGSVSTGADITATAGAAVPSAPAFDVATFTPPTPALPSAVDVSVPINVADVSGMSSSAAAAATSPLTQVFSISKYIQQLAGLYKTVVGLTASHPQAGSAVRLPDGSLNRVNPDGSTTVIQQSGTQTTIGPGGQVASSGAAAGPLVVIAAAIGALFLGQ